MRSASVLSVLAVLSTPSSGFAQALAGEKTFKSRCALCHGQDGTGNPSISRLMQVEFKPMRSEYVQKKSDQELTDIITKGKGKMVPVRGMTAAQINQVIAYLRSLGPGQG